MAKNWAKNVAAGDKSPGAYASPNAGKVKHSAQVGATGTLAKKAIPAPKGHGPE